MVPAGKVLRQQMLEALDQLEDFMGNTILESDNKSPVKYTLHFGDIVFSDADYGRILIIAQRLREMGLDLNITFDVVNAVPEQYVGAETPGVRHVELGTLSGENNAGIRHQISHVRNKIRGDKTEGARVEIRGKKMLLRFNKTTGDVLYGKTVACLSPGTQEYKVLRAILDAPEYAAEYSTICESLEKDNSKTNHTDITHIVKNIKRELDILPGNKRGRNPDMFINVRKRGYRIGVP